MEKQVKIIGNTKPLQGEVSRWETQIIYVDNQIDLKKLCGFKKKVSQKLAWNRIKSIFCLSDDVILVHVSGEGHDLPMFFIQNEHY